MKSMVNLHNSCNEGVDASDDLLCTAGVENVRLTATRPASLRICHPGRNANKDFF